jgi:glycosyltransferase involved in cell wall biosynthesis
MNLLYITRKFPPSVGGMQRFNYKLAASLSKITDVTLIRWGGSQAFLPVFLSWVFLRAIFVCLTKKIDCIYVSDALLSPLGVFLKVIFKKPIVAGVHGRDIAFPLKIYQTSIRWALPQLDKAICVSEELKKECLKRGVSERNLAVIPNGISVEDFDVDGREEARSFLEKRLKISLSNRPVLLTVGRLVPKKGVDSFLINIFPKILSAYPDVIYLIVGDGPLKEKISDLIIKNNYQKNVFAVGAVTMAGKLLPGLYQTAAVFVMPNVPVKGDKEGFGIVALEACAAGRPVVASRVDGITEAIKDNENGFLIKHDSYDEFANVIVKVLGNVPCRRTFGQKAKEFVIEHYTWKKIAEKYLSEFQSLKKT